MKVKSKSKSEVAQLCLTLSNPVDYSLPDSSGHGNFQARVVEWGAIAFSIKNSTSVKMVPVCKLLANKDSDPYWGE